jgi:hypothetical protein
MFNLVPIIVDMLLSFTVDEVSNLELFNLSFWFGNRCSTVLPLEIY